LVSFFNQMDLSILTYPKDLIPEGVDASLWVRYLKGAAAFDLLLEKGQRCPGNPNGIRCQCLIPKDKICLIWGKVAEIADQIGGWTAKHVGGLD